MASDSQVSGTRGARRVRGGSTAAAALSCAVWTGAFQTAALHAANLPVPCVAGSCGNQAAAFVGQGAATAVQAGNTLTVNQTTSSALLNWQSFNIAANGTVTFKQPDTSSLALNRIFQADPSRILGALNANGRIYLLNQNGIVFGAGAQVNVAGLLASSLDLTPQALQQGIAAAAASAAPAFQPYVDASGKPLKSGPVSVEAGAQINSPQGQVFLFAPTVTNDGRINTTDGQTILAAGQRVFLLASTDPNLRGLLVEVGDGGTVTNSGASPTAPAAQIIADRGNVTLAGAVVHQDGVISATTSVRANGSIRLQARDTPLTTLNTVNALQASRGGELELGQGSQTTVALDTTSTEKTVDVNAQPQSSVDLSGKTITVADGAVVRATAGRITALAAANAGQASTRQLTATPDDSQLLIANGALLDVSGATVSLPMERNSLAVQLRGSELADSPLQRNGPLRSQTVYVDVRAYGTRADGSTWVGSPLADLAADIANISRGVQERNLNGGTIELGSQGAVLVSQGATLNTSGGQINWQGGYVRTSQLLGADGRVYNIDTADPNRQYTGIAGPVTVADQRWGVTQQYNVQGFGAGQYQAGYVEGRSAGAVNIIAPRVALDGSIVGTVVRGPLQVRDPRAAFSGGQLIGSIGDVVPSGATLTLGLANPLSTGAPDFVVSNVDFAAGEVLGGPLSGPPAASSLAGLTDIHLRPDLFGVGAVQNLTVYANGTVNLASGSALTLQTGSSLAVNAGQIHINSDLITPSGSVSLTARLSRDFPAANPATMTGLSVAPGVSILAGGQWVNDDAALGVPTFAPLYINGGSVSLSASNGSVSLGTGGVIDVSAGAHMTTRGAVVAGRAGSISIGTSSANGTPTSLSLGKELRGFGLGSGGSVSVSANVVCIAEESCSTAPNELQLLPSWFDAGGFANISVASDLGPLEVLSDTVLNLRQDNLVLAAAAMSAPTGTPMSGISRAEQLPISVRKPVNLTLNGSYLPTDFVASGNLQIDKGAGIIADPLASISLVSNTRILMDGAVRTPGGNISLLLNANAKTNYLPDQAIWLGPDALLDAAGAAVYQPTIFQPNGTQVLSGSVLNGGAIQITAQRGYVFTDPTSVIDVSGVSAPLDVLNGNGSYQRRVIGSNGGSIGFFAVEGMQLNGQMAAHGGGTASAMGGSLSVALDPTNRKGLPRDGYPTGDHNVLVAGSLAPFIVAPGAAAPAQLQGIARVPAALISQGGFDQVTLSARNQVIADPDTAALTLQGYGAVLFEGGVSLNPAARLMVDAPVIGVSGSDSVDLRAAYVSLGTSAANVGVADMVQSVPNPVAGPGVLSVTGDFLDLIGNISVKGASGLHLQSTGDIRARGVFSPAESNYDGQLSVAGSIDLTAQQIYPATLANYALSVSNANGVSGTITTHAVSGTAADVLSAGGTLTLNAAEIDNGGTLRAPLGTLRLVAPTINALPGGLLSTSLNGETVLFGQTQGGLAWTYPLTTGVRVYDSSGVPLPSQNVILQGATINLARGSTVDVSGGGDLLAYEFVPGPGGTRDILAPSVVPNQFAVIPSLHTSFAPFDPLESIGSTIKPGEQVYLTGGAGLAPGYYTLLPARYALLPGAYLVRSVAGYQDLPAGQTIRALDGGTIVSGRLAVAGTPFVAARSSGYEIQPGSVALLDAQYTLSLASTFFTSSSSTTAAAAVRPLLPEDAGAVSVIASSSFVLDALLKANVARAGRGAALQLAGSELLVTNDPSHAPAGVVAVTPAQIDAFGAQTVIIGGQRQNTPSGVGLDVSASSVEVASGAQMSGPDLILIARDLLKLDDGSRISATGSLTGAADSVLQLDANSSLLRVSLAPQLTVTRGSSGTGAGLVQFASSARVQSPGSVALDAGVSAQTSNSFDVTGSLSLAAPSVAIGNAPSSFAGIALDPTRSGTAGVNELILTGRNSIDLYPGASFTAKSLTLTTPVVRAATDGITVQLNADLMQLAGAPAAVPGTLAGSHGSLGLSAREIDGTGQIGLLGFDDTALSASQQLHSLGAGALSTAGSLTLSTGWVTSAAGIDYALAAQGAMTLKALPASALTTTGLGGGFSFSAASITGDVRVAEPSGQIQLAATGVGGNVTLGGATSLTVAGHLQSLGGQSIGAPGGKITLAATQGSISIASGASLDVSAVGSGVSAGTVTLSAPAGGVSFAGSVNGAGTSGAAAGSLNLLAQTFDFASVLGAFSAGGFSGDWSLHLDGSGNLTLPSTSPLRLSSLELTADAGAIDIAGQINADGHRGGRVDLNASGPITVEGTISARATDAQSRGGEVTLLSGSSILLHPGSSIDVSGTTPLDPALPAGGLVDLRLPRSSVLTLLGSNPNNDLLRLGGSIRGARQVSIEGYQTYQAANAQIGAGQVSADPSNPWYTDAATFASQAPQVLAALGKAGDASYQVVPGIEVDSVGDLHLAADWNLYNWRFNGLPGILTLRAGGNLYIDHSLNDGFTDSASFILPTGASPSWSYRLTSGALLSSANPAATVQGSELPGSGNLIIAPGQPAALFSPGVPLSIRTGTGSIHVAAANDVQFGNQASVIYTAGVAGPGIRSADDQSLGGLSNLPYPFNGGDIRIGAGRDIVGPQSGQLYTEWLWRAGAADANALAPHSTAWTVAFDQFEQGIATLGGGNIAVHAGRDIIDLAASTPSIGRQIGGVDPASSVVQVTGGGDLSVTAGRDLLGGTYYSDLGVSQITAGRLIGLSAGQQGRPALAPVLAIGAGSMQAQAGQGLAIATIVNPTLLDVSQQVPSGLTRTYFSTYADDTSVSLRTVSGELDLMGNQPDLLQRFPDYPRSGGAGSSTTALKVLPPSVSAIDLAGSIRVAGSMSLWPAPRGNLQLIAADNVALESAEDLQVLVSDAAPASLPTLAAPVSTLDAVGALLQQVNRGDPRFDAAQPVHDSAVGGLDPNPILIVANSGDVSMQSARGGKTGLLFAPKPIDVYAGRDIVNFSAQIENLSPASVSSLTAGRDFSYQIARDRSGNVEVASGGITVDGPGRVEIIAGRNVNLAASRGIVTQGNLDNRALSVAGANVSVWAGISGKEPGYAAFIRRYLEQSDDYEKLLEDYVLQHQSGGSMSKSAALQAFLGFDLSVQRGLLEQIVFAELRAGGRAAAAAGATHGDFTRAFTALDTLFPGSNPDLAAGQTNPYLGDILLYFSRIYTLAGGDINLIAPGGQINVGLAIAPSSFGITKTPAQLGLVAQSTGSLSALSYSDFQVNQSRAFAADGGNILVWSTEGNIDAGRGAKTAISAPPPVITIDAQGQVQVVFPAALSGSGIQTLATTVGRQPGDVDLFAPRGVVNANDAGIIAGNLTIAATAVLGANNITVSGTSVGVPVETGGLGASLVGAASNAAGAASAAEASVSSVAQQKESPLADSALSWLDVFVIGFGEETCKADDVECLKRQKIK